MKNIYNVYTGMLSIFKRNNAILELHKPVLTTIK